MIKLTKAQWEATMNHLLKHVPEGVELVCYIKCDACQGSVVRSPNIPEALVEIMDAVQKGLESSKKETTT